MTELLNASSFLEFRQWIIGLGIIAGAWILLYLVWKLVAGRLVEWSEKHKSAWSGHIIDLIRLPVNLAIIVVAVRSGTLFLPSEYRYHPVIDLGAKATLIFILAIVLQRILAAIFESKTMNIDVSPGQKSLLLRLLKIFVYLIAALIFLDSAGFSITPILASLGIGSVAIALALQDTLGNLFAGAYLLVDKPFRIGDTLRVDAQTEGEVVHLGWRSTKIRLPANNLVIIPNTKLASATLINFDFPSSITSVVIPCSTAYGEDLERVERVALEVAAAVQASAPGATTNYSPSLAFTLLADSSINFNVVLQAARHADVPVVRHHFIKALHQRFLQEKIEIPFPQRVIHQARTFTETP